MSLDLEIGAATLWMECRGEPEEGQRAVAHVLVNRVRDGRWGKKLSSVCLWPYQFSSWNTTDPNRKAVSQLSERDLLFLKLDAILCDAVNEPEADPTNGATHYYADSIPEPNWVSGATFCKQIGHHKFYKDVK